MGSKRRTRRIENGAGKKLPGHLRVTPRTFFAMYSEDRVFEEYFGFHSHMSEYISQPVGWVESHIHIHSSCIRHFQMFCFRLIHVNRSLRLNNRNNYCTEAGLSCLTVTGVSAPAHARSSEVSVPSVNCENVETSKHIRLSISTEMTERMSGLIYQPGTTEFTWTRM